MLVQPRNITPTAAIVESVRALVGKRKIVGVGISHEPTHREVYAIVMDSVGLGRSVVTLAKVADLDLARSVEAAIVDIYKLGR